MTAAIPLFDTATQLAPLRDELDLAVRRVLDSGRFILGPEVQAFEREFAAYSDAEHAIGVGNGTDALMIALRAAGVEPSDDVVVPSFTFYATAEAVAAIGARPVFCDVDPATFNVTRETVEAAITPATKAIVAVHLFGLPAPMPALRELADERGLKLIEDAAQAAGAKLHGVPAGSLGDAAAFSFFPSKNLGAFGDAGAITTSDPDLAERADLLRRHGSTDKQLHALVGYNSRLDAIQAALLRVLLPHLDAWNGARRTAARAYDDAGIAEVAAPQSVSKGFDPVFHLYVVSHREPERAMLALTGEGIEARGYYRTPIHRQPAMKHFLDGTPELPGTEAASAANIALPMSPVLTAEQAGRVVTVLKSLRDSA